MDYVEFDPEKYHPNNIRFRTVACKAISQFKENQAFDFNELSCKEKCEIPFSDAAKETILLYYDVMFKYLLTVETMFIKMDRQKNLDSVTIERMNELYIDHIVYIIRIFKSHPDVFKHINFGFFNTEKQELINKLITKRISTFAGDNIYKVFPILASFLSDILNGIMLDLYEYENTINNNESNDFIAVTDCTIYYYKYLDINILAEKVQALKTEDEVKEIDIKIFTDGNLKLVDLLISDLQDMKGVIVKNIININ